MDSSQVFSISNSTETLKDNWNIGDELGIEWLHPNNWSQTSDCAIGVQIVTKKHQTNHFMHEKLTIRSVY